MSAADARLFELLDGSRMLPELVAEAERLEGPAGPGRLVRLLVDLGDRGLLEGVRGAERGTAPVRRLERLFRPRERDLRGAGAWLQRTYRRAAWLLFTSPALAVLAALAVGGIGVFTYLIAQALWHAVRRREQDRHRRARLPPRALRRRRRPRDRARADPRLVRPPRRARRPQVGLRVPVCLRRYVAGVVRAAPPANRGERCRPAERPGHGRPVLARVPGRGARHRARHLLPARVRGLRRRLLQPQPVPRPRRLPDPRRRPARAWPAAALPRAAPTTALGRGAAAGRLAGAVPLRRGRRCLVRGRCRLCHRAVDALLLDTRATGAQGRRVGRARKPVRDAVHARRLTLARPLWQRGAQLPTEVRRVRI